MTHASVKLDGMEIPLIGIPMAATQEKCDCCRKEFHLQSVALQFCGFFFCPECQMLDPEYQPMQHKRNIHLDSR